MSVAPLFADTGLVGTGLAGAFFALALSVCTLVVQQRCPKALRRPATAGHFARPAGVSVFSKSHFNEVTR